MMRLLLRWLWSDDDLGAIPITADRLREGEAYTERQAWGWAGPAQSNPTAAQRARKACWHEVDIGPNGMPKDTCRRCGYDFFAAQRARRMG